MPKTDLKTLIGKRDNAIQSIRELFEEFETILAVEPNLERLEIIFNLVETKYRQIKKQQEALADRIVEDGQPEADEMLKANSEVGGGCRRSYSTWKKEFSHWMIKYSQDEDEQLQRFRKAMPKGFWWTDQVKTCKSIDRAWNILDVEFADKRKLMDELLMGINNLKPVKRDSKSLAHYASLITGYVNDMEDNACPVSSSSEAPFFMSQLLSKLSPGDNSAFGREMKRDKKEENSNFATSLFGCRRRQVFVREGEITLRRLILALPLEDPRTALETLKYKNLVLLVANLNTYLQLAPPIRV